MFPLYKQVTSDKIFNVFIVGGGGGGGGGGGTGIIGPRNII